MGSGVKGCMCVNGEQQEASSMACRMNEKEEINTLAAPSEHNRYNLDSFYLSRAELLDARGLSPRSSLLGAHLSMRKKQGK